MFRQLRRIMGREFLYLWRDSGLRRILLLASLLGLFLFFGIYSTQVLKDIPTAVVDLDGSAASGELVRSLGAAENLKITSYPDNYDDLQEMVKRGETVVGVVIPENFGKNTALGRQTNILVAVDTSNMVYATNAGGAVLTTARTMGAKAGVKTLIAKGVHPLEAAEAFQGVNFHEQAWFNPTLNYAHFMVLGLALNIWQQCCTLTAAANVVGERKMSSWHQVKASGVSKLRFFLGKSAVHIFVFMALVLPIFALAFGPMGLPLKSDPMMLLAFTLVFALSLHGLGTMMSSIAKDAVDAARFGMIIALPSFVISGYTWPLEAMPGILQKLAWLLPQTWFFQGINYLTFKNPGWGYMSQYFYALLIIALICYGVSTAVVSRY
ncbi:MAG: ABC transporter permease [Clostridia bacterium]|nr:ABC transporter permease [Clostridia bacterium]